MKFSIITVSYNAVASIEACVLSVLSQDYPDVEYIVVDGDSNDGTLGVLEKYKHRFANYLSERDEGLYHALNKGIALATGDVIGILHADDFYTTSSVLSQYAKVFEKERCDAVYSDLYYVDAIDITKIVRKWKSGYYTPGAFLNGWMPPHPTFFVKREVYQRLGNFNREFKTAADYELMLRFIHKNQIKLSYLPEYTIKMRTGGQSNSSIKNRIRANREDRKAWEVNGLRPRFYTLYFKPLRKILQFF
jgi:glycosyltransferase involved in cell wall biosynthesis